MSRKNHRNSDDVGNFVIGILGFVGLLIVGLISWIMSWFETPLMEQIQQLDRKAYWGAEIKARACPQCAVANEAHQYTCYQCGMTLIDISTATTKASQSNLDKIKRKLVKAVLILFGLLVIVLILIAIGAQLGFY